MTKRRTALCWFFIVWVTASITVRVHAEEPLTDPEILAHIANAPNASDYSGVPAVVLFDHDKYYINEDGTATYESHILGKILHKKGRYFGEISLAFTQDRSTLDIVFARTIKPDKTVINIGKGDIREVAPYSQIPVYSAQRLKQFSMPAVDVGSFIEYKAIETIIQPEMPGLFDSSWVFRFGMPTLQATLEINVPEHQEITYATKRLHVAPVIRIENGRKIYTWTAKNIHVKDAREPLMPPYLTITPRLEFSTIHEWDKVAQWYNSVTEPQLETNESIEKFVHSLIQHKRENKQEIIQALYDFVARDIRYVSIPLNNSGYLPHKVVDTYANKFGDCKDKSALLVSLYRVAGIQAHFALLRQRSQGPIMRDIPALDFTHAIVAVPDEAGRFTFLDSTLEFARVGYVPTEMQDVDIFVIKKDGYEFVKLPIELKDISRRNENIEMEIGDDYIVKVNEETKFFGGQGEMAIRAGIKYSTREDLWPVFEKAVRGMYANSTLIDINFSNPENLSEVFTSNFKYEIRDHIKEAGNLRMFLLPFEGGQQLISTEKRYYPMWFRELGEVDSTTKLTIPVNHKIVFLPAGLEINNTFLYFKAEITSVDRQIMIKNTFKTKMLEIPAEHYDVYRESMEKMLKHSSQSIVLEKLS